MDGQGPEDDADGAERAFEALREEVAAHGQLLERVAATLTAQGKRSELLTPDYSPTLGIIAKSLQAMEARLAAIEDKPALTMTPEVHRRRLEEVGRSVGDRVESALRDGARAQNAASHDLQQMFVMARTAKKQNDWLVSVGLVGVMAGMLLWAILVMALPVGMSETMAVLPLNGGDRWLAGQTLMDHVDPASWNRLAALSRACGNQKTEVCEAAMTVRTIPPVPKITQPNQ